MLGVLPWIVASFHQHCCRKTTNSKTNSVYFSWRVNLSNLPSKQSVLAPHTQWDTVAFRECSGDLLKIFFPQYCSKTELSNVILWGLFLAFSKGMLQPDLWKQSGVSSTAFFGQAVWVGGQQLSLQLRCIYSPKRVSWLSCQSCLNDIHRRPLPSSFTHCCCIVRCQSRWVARHRAQQTGSQRGRHVGRQT